MFDLSKLSNRAKKLWASLLLDTVIAVNIFPKLFSMKGDLGSASESLVDIVVTVFLMAILGSLVIHWFLKIGKPEPRDERDYQFEAKSHIAGYITLFTAICLLIGHVMMNEVTKSLFQFEYEILNAGQISVYMLLSLVVAAFVKDAVRLFYYSRGY